MIKSLLIANRGEIACRITRTAKAMGMRVVAVYSQADAEALHVRLADVAVPIGASLASESYLVGEKLIAAARQTGAEAIHPGYGFLSENADFAQAVLDAKLIWVGPNPASIRAMGLKDAAKALMAKAGVATTPGYMGEQQSTAFLARQAEKIGYPVLVKAVAGGGGKGMRKIEEPADFADHLASCQREAQASFGNASVLIEKYIQRPRHIEVQVFGDSHGNIVHLFERDCSLQRRHQKVIEEAPAPGMDEETRTALCAAAVKAARAVRYVGAGTIEFIADVSDGLRADRIWFMEMNTRLQVEHPVTEEVTGIDMVEWQLRIASGEALPMRQEDVSLAGHAIEARVYAEDPAAGFLPSTGALDLFRLGATKPSIGSGTRPSGTGPSGTGRIDTGVTQGEQISPFYDPMIAKIIAHGATREQARRQLIAMLGATAIWPVKTNTGFLLKTLEHSDFVAGNVDTGLIDRDGQELARLAPPSMHALTKAAVTLAPLSPLAGFRLNAPARRSAAFLLDDTCVNITLSETETQTPETIETIETIETAEAPLSLCIAERGHVWELKPLRCERGTSENAADGAILSPMPGRIIAVKITQGDRVTKGQKLLTLEAMKMEHSLTAPFDGVIAELKTQTGAQIEVDALLVRVEKKTQRPRVTDS